MSSLYASSDSQSKDAEATFHGIFPRQYAMEALKFNAPRCFKGFRSYQNDINSSTNGLFVNQTNQSKDFLGSAQNPICLDDESEHMKEFQREFSPQMNLKGLKVKQDYSNIKVDKQDLCSIIANKVDDQVLCNAILADEPLQPPRKILRRSTGKRDFPICVKRYNHSNAGKNNVCGDEVFNSSADGKSGKYPPRRVLNGDCPSVESFKCGKTPLKGLKFENKYGDEWKKGYQQVCDEDISYRVKVKGLKFGNKYGDEWKKGYQQLGDEDLSYRVKDTIELFRRVLRKFQQENKVNPDGHGHYCYKAASNVLKRNGKWLNTDKCLGSVSGVEIGDEFQSKMELKVIGLHHRQFCGIDYLVQNGVKLATSVVATGRYANKMKGSDVLVYIGEGGNPQVQSKRPLEDQKLVRGNLALKNSIERKTPVKVIRKKKSQCQNVANLVYVYEGLYLAESYRQYRGKSGKLIFEFLLRKVSQNTINENKGVLTTKQNIELDVEKSPLSSNESTTNNGCGCGDGCFESLNCLCITKNDGKMPYDYDGCLIRKLPLVYECGPYCKCSLSCMNRVSQQRTQAKLELFKNKFSKYGVRSKSYILKGSFICKYVPRKEFLGNEISKEIDIPKDVSASADVGRFIGNSSSPTLYGQEIIIGNEDKSHLMLFAMRNISPWEELTIGHMNQILNT